VRARLAVFVVAVGFGGLSSLVGGCAVEEAQAREADYPQAIGYTPVGTDSPATPPPPPPQQAALAPPASGPPGAPPPPPSAEGPGNWQSAPPPPQGPPDGAGAGGQVAGGQDDAGDYSDADPSALSDFRSTLDPYGNWVEDPTYGSVWVPSPSVVGDGFTPYASAGHWAYDDDYVWVSDYDWGWAPFHYGRWVYAGPMGWEWLPGRTYAGAWVSWRYGVGDWGYVGWAPLGPTWCWRGGVAVGMGFVPRAPYSFVGAHELFAPAVGGRLITGPQVSVVASHTQPFVPASPRVSSSLGMRFAVGGPPLAALHIAPSAAVRVSAATNRGLAQAQAFARPGTAVALGAHGPQLAAPRAQASFPSTRLSGTVSSSRGLVSAPRIPAYAASEPSHFGGRLGAGFAGDPASAPAPRAYSGSGAAYGGASREAAPPTYGGRPSGMSPGGAYRSYSPPSAAYSGGASRASGAGGASAPTGGALHGASGSGVSRSGGGRGGGRR